MTQLDPFPRGDSSPGTVDDLAEFLAASSTGPDWEPPVDISRTRRREALDVWEFWHDFRTKPMTFEAWRKRYRGEVRTRASDQRAWERLRSALRLRWANVVAVLVEPVDDLPEAQHKGTIRVSHAARRRADLFLDYAAAAEEELRTPSELRRLEENARTRSLRRYQARARAEMEATLGQVVA